MERLPTGRQEVNISYGANLMSTLTYGYISIRKSMCELILGIFDVKDLPF